MIMIPFLIAAGVYDFREKKIPNHLIWSGWSSALIIRFWQEGATGVLYCMAAMLLPIAIGFPVYRMRAVGAGDVKLMSVIGGMHGLDFLFSVFVVWLMFSGIASLFILLRRRIFAERFRYFWIYFTTGGGNGKPYYDKGRDTAKCTIILAPIAAVSYILVLLGKWRGIV